jgi:hypothetical protein
MNFWSWLIQGGAEVIAAVIQILPTQFVAVRQTLSAVPTILNFAAGPLLLFVGSFIDLRLFLVTVTIMTVGEIARAFLSTWRFIMKNLPALLGGN